MKKLVYILFAILISGASVLAQDEGTMQEPKGNWPEDPEAKKEAQRQWVMLEDAINASNWTAARSPFVWLYSKYPDLKKGLYIYGSKIYENLERAEKDKTIKSGLQDTALLLYDERIKYFQEEANVKNRKGLLAFNYLINRKTENEKLYTLYTEIFELNGDDSYATCLYALVKMNCKKHESGDLTKEQVMDVYMKVTETYERKIADGNKNADIQMKDATDKAFAECVEILCEDIEKIMVPKFKANKQDLKAAKQIVGFKNSAKCDKDDIFYEAQMLIVDKEPSCGGAMGSGKRAKKESHYDWALKFFEKALEICPEESKSEIYYEMAGCYVSKGQKQTARDFARKSIAAGGSHVAASYNLIGDIYYNSVRDCDPQNVVLFRSRYIAAYEMYKKGGSSSGMAKTQSQFPSMDDLFTDNLKVGDSFNTGCWINEDVILQKR